MTGWSEMEIVILSWNFKGMRTRLRYLLFSSFCSSHIALLPLPLLPSDRSCRWRKIEKFSEFLSKSEIKGHKDWKRTQTPNPFVSHYINRQHMVAGSQNGSWSTHRLLDIKVNYALLIYCRGADWTLVSLLSHILRRKLHPFGFWQGRDFIAWISNFYFVHIHNCLTVTEDKMSVLGLYFLLSCPDSYKAHHSMLRSCITEHKKLIQRFCFEKNGKVLLEKCKANWCPFRGRRTINTIIACV